MPKKADDRSTSVSFKTRLIATGTKPAYHFLRIEQKWAKALQFPGNLRRCRCTVNGKLKFPCSLLPSGEEKGSFYIWINKANREKYGLNAGDEVEVELVRDDSKYGMPMPAEFKEVLRQDKEAKKLFDALTPGKQRSFIWYTIRYKDEDRRIQAALIIMDHLKKHDGKTVWKELSEELKMRREPEW